MHSTKNQMDKSKTWMIFQLIFSLIFAGSSIYFLNRHLYNESKTDAWLIIEEYDEILASVVDFKHFNSGGYVWSIIDLKYKYKGHDYYKNNVEIQERDYTKQDSNITVFVSTYHPEKFMTKFHYNDLKWYLNFFLVGNVLLLLFIKNTISQIFQTIKKSSKA